MPTFSTAELAAPAGTKCLESWLVCAGSARLTPRGALSKEGFMAFVTGDVVAVSGEELPFKVIFKQGETVLAEWLVESKEDGEGQIVETLKSLVDDDEFEDEVDGE
jgi:hypothetical protein